jgi:putative hydrolase of the HAD superfamily
MVIWLWWRNHREPRMKLKYRAVLFDLDDTLFDHQRHRRDALKTLAQAAGFGSHADILALECAHDRHSERAHQLLLAGELSLEQERIERTRGALLEFGVSLNEKKLLDLENIYLAAYDREWKTVPGAIELLRALRQAGAWISVITNGHALEQYPKLQRLGLTSLLDDVVVSEEAGCEKPSRQYFEHALARARCHPGECVVVGDLWHTDIIGAHQSGIDAIWLNRYARPLGPDARAVEITGFVPIEETLRLFQRAADPGS